MASSELTRREYRKQLRARLAETQAALLTPLLGLSAVQLASPSLPDGQSPLGILQEQANADAEATAVLQVFLGDEVTPAGESETKIAGGVSGVIARFLAARRLLLDTMARISDNDLDRPIGNGATPAEIMGRRYVDSARRAAEVASSASQRVAPNFGPHILILAALRAARKELLTTIALISEDERPEYGLPDGASLRSHLAVVASRDRELLRDSDHHPDDGIAISRAAEWHTVWRELHAIRHRLLETLEPLTSEDLYAATDRYADICRLVDADRALASSLRESLHTIHHAGPGGLSP